MWPNPHGTADLVTFTDEILNGKLRFFVQSNEINIKGQKKALKMNVYATHKNKTLHYGFLW